MIKFERLAAVIVSIVIFSSVLYSQPPIAEGKDKFLGNIYNTSQITDFAKYWNQVSPENAGKWGSVQPQNATSWNFGQLDAAYNLAKNNGFPFRMHVMIWGSQQPAWMQSLDSAAQMTHIIKWFDTISKRYPDIDMVEVVNEPLHAPPACDATNTNATNCGGYIDALGGAEGWKWVINSFKLARQYFPNSILMINDYNIVGSANNTNRLKNIVTLLQQDSLIDAIGFQGHAFSTMYYNVTSMQSNINNLASTGLPIYVTELDIDGLTDVAQVIEYQRVFTMLWEHEAIKGITLWGWRPGMWRAAQGANIVTGTTTTVERPAIQSLRAYVNNEFVPATGVTLSTEDNITDVDQNNSTLQVNATILPTNTTITKLLWTSSNVAVATVSQTGLVTGKTNGTATIRATIQDGTNRSGTLLVNSSILDNISKNELSPILSIYPNPSNGEFTIEYSQHVNSLNIYNITGKLIENIPINNMTNKVTYNSRLSSGIYFIQVVSSSSVTYEKIIIN